MSAGFGLSVSVVPDNVNRVLEERRAISKGSRESGPWLLESPRLAPVLALASKIAAMPTAPVIVTGERGTGTSELARWVHDHDLTTCSAHFAAMPGHLASPTEVRGRALQGTLFIDDVESLRPASQAWLLRLVSEREMRKVAIRVIVSTKRSVPDLLTARHLNPELVYALDVARLSIPPLRERPEEILLLANRFLRVLSERIQKPLSGFSAAAESKLLSYGYGANVRELRNVVERAVVMEDSDEVQAGSIVFYSDRPQDDQPGKAIEKLPRKRVDPERLPTLAEVERDYLVTLLRNLRGCRAEVSRAMGVSYPTVLKKIARHGLDVRAIVAATDDAAAMLAPRVPTEEPRRPPA
jgi:DNA-binding NtrC family response regulator